MLSKLSKSKQNITILFYRTMCYWMYKNPLNPIKIIEYINPYESINYSLENYRKYKLLKPLPLEDKKQNTNKNLNNDNKSKILDSPIEILYDDRSLYNYTDQKQPLSDSYFMIISNNNNNNIPYYTNTTRIINVIYIPKQIIIPNENNSLGVKFIFKQLYLNICKSKHSLIDNLIVIPISIYTYSFLIVCYIHHCQWLLNH